MKRRLDSDPRQQFYLVRCETCGFILKCDKAPMKASREAQRHAKRCPSHSVVVLNLSTLTVAKTYTFEPLPTMANEPPF